MNHSKALHNPVLEGGGNANPRHGLRSIGWAAALAALLISPQTITAGSFSTDFSSQPAGVQIYGDPGDGTAGVIADGALKLTTLVGSITAGMVIDDLDAGEAVSAFTVTFNLLIGGGSGADGFSFSFGSDVADGGISEEGSGTGLIVAFDSYDNGNGEAPAIDLKIGGAEVATSKIAPRSVLAANKFLPVRINLDNDGTVDVSYGDMVIYTNFYTAFMATPGRFAFGARTGGSYDNHWVDDLQITTSTGPQVTPPHPLVVTNLPGASGNSPETTINVTIMDFATKVTTSTVKLKVNGVEVTPTVAKAGDLTTVQYDPPGLFEPESVNTYEVVYADDGTPPFYTTNLFTFKVVPYNSIVLPAPIILETFNSTEEGALPAGWVETNATTSLNPGIDFDDPNSDAYLSWTVLERSRMDGAPFDARRLNVAPGYLNGAPITSLIDGRFVYAESDNRGGNQIQMLFSPDFDLTGKSDIYVSYNSVYEQNQDSLGALEYSIDQGATWKPVVIMLDQVDIVLKADGTVDPVATLTNVQTDTPEVDDGAGGTRRTAYGEFLANKDFAAMGPYISGRVNDNAIESKRVELFRLPAADNQAKVRFRFVQAGTGSWYWGFDNFGLYSIPSPGYRIGLNFGADEPDGGKKGGLAAGDKAGVSKVAQANWNNLSGVAGTNTAIVGDAQGASQPTSVTVTWTCPNTWSSTGRGEENNQFAEPNKTLMLGYLDTGNASTTPVTILNLPEALTSEGYDVYVYAVGGVGARGGGYRIVDADTKEVLKDYIRAQGPTNNTDFVQVVPSPATNVWAVGNYMVFSGLNAPNIIVEATTANGLGFSATPRAPINAIQLVAPPSSTPPPPKPKVSIEQTAAGVTITFTGTLQSADQVEGPYSDVVGTSPMTVTPAAGSVKFYRSVNR